MHGVSFSGKEQAKQASIDFSKIKICKTCLVVKDNLKPKMKRLPSITEGPNIQLLSSGYSNHTDILEGCTPMNGKLAYHSAQRKAVGRRALGTWRAWGRDTQRYLSTIFASNPVTTGFGLVSMSLVQEPSALPTVAN